MRVVVSSPVRPGSTSGNATTASRWSRRLSELGHDVSVLSHADRCETADLVVVLHARRGAETVRRYAARGERPKIVVAFTGTDVNGDLSDPDVVSSIRLGDAFVFLEPSARDRVGITGARPSVVIHQAVETIPSRCPDDFAPVGDDCQFAVLSHLRPVKDPFRAAEAVRLLPDDSTVRVLHGGAPHDDDSTREAGEMMKRSPRYRWLGDLGRMEALCLLSKSRALILSSLSEGGANVVSEAVTLGKPVLATRISGTVGLLGSGYPGYFEVGDTEGLARLLQRFASQPQFELELLEWCAELKSMFDPTSERESWRVLVDELVPSAQ